jgi:trk system potassium uptake protein
MTAPKSLVRYAPTRRHRKATIGISPPMVLVGSFALLIVLGTLALKLPWATQHPISWYQSLFTAVSAVTVTGLAVVDTATGFSFFGQIIIAVLIQCGGIGLMTFALVTAASLGWRISLRNQLMAREALNQTNLSHITQTARAVLLLTLIIEAMGLLVLWLYWWPDLGWHSALWHGLFYAVSAFNNAGFALASDSLSQFVADPMINVTITSLFIIGGLGFTVLTELWHYQRGKRLSIYTRLMLYGTLSLNLVAMITMALLEWNNPGTLGSLPTVGAKLWAAWFQAVTPRTAGFNSVDLSQLSDASSLFMILLMFIGGGVNSTASGIKLSTFVVLMLATIAFLRRRPAPQISGRSIGQDTVYKAMAITFLAVITLFFAVFILSLTEQAPFLDVVFEAVSAMGTVGVSRGLTGQLSAAGQMVIMALMFIGRVGPLTMAYLLTAHKPQHTQYPETELQVG